MFLLECSHLMLRKFYRLVGQSRGSVCVNQNSETIATASQGASCPLTGRFFLALLGTLSALLRSALAVT
jgi:hypothetical protein